MKIKQWLYSRFAKSGLNIWEAGLYILLILGAAALRFWELDLRPIHHDESLHAYYSWKLFTGQGYQHDPMMHGPFQFFGTSLVYHLLGDSDYTSRVMPAFFGTVLVGLPFLLRRELGRVGALVAAAMLVLSPSFLYLSRFARNDIYIAVWTLLLVFCLWRYIEKQQARYLYLGAAVLSLSFATKETTFITAAIFASFFLLARWREFLSAIRGRLALSSLSAPAFIFVWILSLSLPLYSAGMSLFQGFMGITLANASEKAGLIGSPLGMKGIVPAVAIMAIFFGVAGIIGLSLSHRRYLTGAAIFWSIYILLFTSFFHNLLGLGTGIWGSLSYWLIQHSENRLAQPWFYYLLILSYYEFMPLLLALVAAVYYARKRDLFTAFLIYWAGVGIVLFSLAGEKAPWLVLHMALPLMLLGARFAGEVIKGNLGKLPQWLGVGALLFLFVITGRVSWQTNYQRGDLPPQMLVYAQGSADLLVIRDKIEKLAAQTGQGKQMEMTIDSELSWPWVWYLRDYPNTSYIYLPSGNLPGDVEALVAGKPVVLVGAGNEGRLSPYLKEYGRKHPFHQIIWSPDSYNKWHLADFVSARGWREWWDYFAHRATSTPYRAKLGVAYFQQGSP